MVEKIEEFKAYMLERKTALVLLIEMHTRELVGLQDLERANELYERLHRNVSKLLELEKTYEAFDFIFDEEE